MVWTQMAWYFQLKLRGYSDLLSMQSIFCLSSAYQNTQVSL
jgi:hypothetical protein